MVYNGIVLHCRIFNVTCHLFVLGMFTRPFSKSDPRLKVALEVHEPLVHFALVCGAKSCPPIKTYTSDVSMIGSISVFIKKQHSIGCFIIYATYMGLQKMAIY